MLVTVAGKAVKATYVKNQLLSSSINFMKYSCDVSQAEFQRNFCQSDSLYILNLQIYKNFNIFLSQNISLSSKMKYYIYSTFTKDNRKYFYTCQVHYFDILTF